MKKYETQLEGFEADLTAYKLNAYFDIKRHDSYDVQYAEKTRHGLLMGARAVRRAR